MKIGAARVPPYKVTKGPVQANVASYKAYWQASPQVSHVEQLDQAGQPTRLTSSVGQGFGGLRAPVITGRALPSDIGVTSVRVDQAFAGASEVRDRVGAFDRDPGDLDPMQNIGDPRWRLDGAEVNHLTVAWYAYREAKDDLS